MNSPSPMPNAATSLSTSFPAVDPLGAGGISTEQLPV